MNYFKMKRLLDLFAAVILIMVLFPIFIIISLWILIVSKGPIIFKQTRVGYHNQPFTIYKFRTMKIDAPNNLPSKSFSQKDFYLIRFGKWLKRSNLDEIPQLINVLKGEMSIIGPRPVIENEIDLIQLRNQLQVYTVRPGITGLAQVHSIYDLNPEDKAKIDGIYVQNLSLIQDLKIIFKTLKHLIVKRHY
jgi:O-antigen biosynthesis protein WbqP